MSRIPSLGPIEGPASQTPRGNDLREVDVDTFLGLMIAELQNQDPMNPLDNSELVQQISQIREIGATNQLTETLQAVITGQNLATASGLIGKRVTALSDDGQSVQGIVDRVSVAQDRNDGEQRPLKVHVGTHSIDIENIQEIADSGG